MLLSKNIHSVVRNALKEDVSKGDITTFLTIPSQLKGKGIVVAQEKGVLCGIEVVKAVFKQLDKQVKFKALKKDGSIFKKGEKLAIIQAKMRTILTGERVALNFLSLLSGVATLTKKIVDKTKGMKAKIKDTRKTVPNLRKLEKYAVRVGGGYNHRISLSDGIIVKDNHLKAAGYIHRGRLNKQKFCRLVSLLKKKSSFKIEVEVENLSELRGVAIYKPDIIMLDNFSVKNLKTAVKLRNEYYPKIKLEASGGVNLGNVRAIACSGVDYISLGMITDSPCAIDFSLDIDG